MQYALLLPGAYLVGSIPWGLIAGKLRGGIDVRQYGSGTTGTTNVMRTLGPRVATLVMVADVSKGVVVVLLARAVVDAPLAEALAATLAIIGHNWPVFGGFRGGRGVTVGVGGLGAITPLGGAIALGVFIPTVALTRYASLGSVLAVASALIIVPVMVAIGDLDWAYVVYVGVGCPVILWQHRGNIQRLLRGTERRIGQQEVRPPADELPSEGQQ